MMENTLLTFSKLPEPVRPLIRRRRRGRRGRGDDRMYRTFASDHPIVVLRNVGWLTISIGNVAWRSI